MQLPSSTLERHFPNEAHTRAIQPPKTRPLYSLSLVAPTPRSKTGPKMLSPKRSPEPKSFGTWVPSSFLAITRLRNPVRDKWSKRDYPSWKTNSSKIPSPPAQKSPTKVLRSLVGNSQLCDFLREQLRRLSKGRRRS